MAKLVLVILAAILAVVFAYPASEQETPLSRLAREAKPDPHFGGFGVIGGFKVGGFGGYGLGYRPHGYGHGYGGYGGYGGYPGYYGGYGIPYGGASYASAKAGSIGFGR